MSRKNIENTEHRRGRKPMTEAQKEAARAQRAVDATNRDAAVNAITGNSQFCDPRTWAALEPKLLAEVKAAIGKVEGRLRKAEIKALEKRLAALQAE